MKYNLDPSFVGIEKLIEVHAIQIRDFEDWAAHGDWERFHDSHYDWWVFPVDRSSSYGYAWTVYEGEVAVLQSNADFMARYREGVRLVSASWGWDLPSRGYFPAPAEGQGWHHWPVRLFKAAQSTLLFSQADEFGSLKALALDLMAHGERMTYYRWDLSWIFTTGIDPYHQP